MLQRTFTANVTNLVAGSTRKGDTGISVIVDAGAAYQSATLVISFRQKGSSGPFSVLDNTLVAGDQQTYSIGGEVEIAVSVTGAGSPAPSIPVFINSF